MCIDIVEIYFGVACGQILSVFNRVTCPQYNSGRVLLFHVFIAAVNKAYKTLENEEGLKRCREIIEEAKARVNEMVNILVSASYSI